MKISTTTLQEMGTRGVVNPLKLTKMKNKKKKKMGPEIICHLVFKKISPLTISDLTKF